MQGTRRLGPVVLYLLIMMLTVFVSLVQAEEDRELPGTGLSVSLQGNQYEIIIPVWIGEGTVITPVFDLSSARDNYTAFSLGLGVRTNISYGKVVTYAGLRAKALAVSTSADTDWDALAGPFIGAEYFFSRHFSVSAEARINVWLPGDLSLRGWDEEDVSTQTAALATVYF